MSEKDLPEHEAQCSLIEYRCDDCKIVYATLKFINQMKVFKKTPPNTRKIIVATNTAKMSITISGKIKIFFFLSY